MKSLRTTFRQHGLPVPVIPESLRRQVSEQRAWVWGTKPDSPRLYDIDAHVAAAVEHPTESVLIGHDGYGTNAWFLHCYLCHGPLHVFIQTSWGGAFTDAAEATSTLTRQYQTLAELVRAAEEVTLAGKALPGRLVIEQSDKETPRWAWVCADKPVSWNEEDSDALTAALLALRA